MSDTASRHRYQEYVPGTALGEDEYLLKVSGKGFMTKLTKKGQVPTSLQNWRPTLKTYVIEETFREGWQVVGERRGMSQSWVELRHPHGFVLEITVEELVEIMEITDIRKGTIQGKWKWFASDAKRGHLVQQKEAKRKASTAEIKTEKRKA